MGEIQNVIEDINNFSSIYKRIEEHLIVAIKEDLIRIGGNEF
jgi:hypothetical protein